MKDFIWVVNWKLLIPESLKEQDFKNLRYSLGKYKIFIRTNGRINKEKTSKHNLILRKTNKFLFIFVRSPWYLFLIATGFNN